MIDLNKNQQAPSMLCDRSENYKNVEWYVKSGNFNTDGHHDLIVVNQPFPAPQFNEKV